MCDFGSLYLFRFVYLVVKLLNSRNKEAKRKIWIFIWRIYECSYVCMNNVINIIIAYEQINKGGLVLPDWDIKVKKLYLINNKITSGSPNPHYHMVDRRRQIQDTLKYILKTRNPFLCTHKKRHREKVKIIKIIKILKYPVEKIRTL